MDAAAGQGGEWVACEPCTILVFGVDAYTDRASAAITVAPTPEPIRPSLEVLSHEVTPEGMALTVRGSGFQFDGPVDFGLCHPRADDGGSPQCGYSSVPGTLQADGRGGFTVDAFYNDLDLRGLGEGPSCTTLPLPCVLGVQPGEGLGLAVTAPVPPYP